MDGERPGRANPDEVTMAGHDFGDAETRRDQDRRRRVEGIG